MNPLNSIRGTIIGGLVLVIVAILIINGVTDMETARPGLAFDRWLHILAGITWIGLLYYFNFIQVPAQKKAAEDTSGPGGAAIGKYVAPLALAWFRWAALITFLTGLVYLFAQGNLGTAAALGLTQDPVSAYHLTIGIGGYLGTIMFLNVWVLIWPNQKKVLGMVEASEDEKAKAKKIAFYASRTNTLLSLPMLLCMVGAPHTMGAAGHGLWW